MGLRSIIAIAALTAIVLTPALATTASSASFSKDYVGMSTSHLSNCIVDGKDLCQPDTILTVHVARISGSTFCTLLTGTWCDGPLPLPTPDSRILADTHGFETTSPL